MTNMHCGQTPTVQSQTNPQDDNVNNPKVYVEKYEGLTVDFCMSKNVKHIVRGLRNAADFEFEKKIAQFNNSLENVETIFFISSPNNAFISSSMVREIMDNGGNFKKFVPDSVLV